MKRGEVPSSSVTKGGGKTPTTVPRYQNIVKTSSEAQSCFITSLKNSARGGGNDTSQVNLFKYAPSLTGILTRSNKMVIV